MRIGAKYKPAIKDERQFLSLILSGSLTIFDFKKRESVWVFSAFFKMNQSILMLSFEVLKID